MKLLFDYYSLQHEFKDTNVKFGIGWYRHHTNHPWFGFSVQFYLYFWVFHITYVDNFKAYDERVNYRKHK